jgi:ABC-2 type transport system ATP-binding protein
MDDIEQLCSRVMVINRGEIGYDGTIPQLRERIGLPTSIKLTYRNPLKLPAATDLPFELTEATDHTLTIQCNRQIWTAMDVLRLASEWGDIVDVHMEEPEFEDMIHKLY